MVQINVRIIPTAVSFWTFEPMENLSVSFLLGLLQPPINKEMSDDPSWVCFLFSFLGSFLFDQRFKFFFSFHPSGKITAESVCHIIRESRITAELVNSLWNHLHCANALWAKQVQNSFVVAE